MKEYEELIAALKDAECYLFYVAPNCYASCEAIKAIRAAADALEAAERKDDEQTRSNTPS